MPAGRDAKNALGPRRGLKKIYAEKVKISANLLAKMGFASKTLSIEFLFDFFNKILYNIYNGGGLFFL
jgi:hypothetical protein